MGLAVITKASWVGLVGAAGGFFGVLCCPQPLGSETASSFWELRETTERRVGVWAKDSKQGTKVRGEKRELLTAPSEAETNWRMRDFRYHLSV